MKKYDLIVVGAGPSGLLAAKAAGTAGLEVALIDRKSDLTRLERLCGQTIVSMNDYYFDDLAFYNPKEKKMGFSKNGFSFSYDGPVKNCYAWHLYSPNGTLLPFGLPEETRKKGDDGAIGIAFDKEILFKCLLEEVEKAGVGIFPGVDIREVSTIPDGVKVSSKDKTFEGSYLIAADGANSRIARILGFNKDRTFYSYLLVKGGYLRNVKPPEPDIMYSSFTFKPVAPGYMFMLPRVYEDDFTVAFITLDPRVGLDEVANYFMSENPFFSKWFKDSKWVKQLAFSQYIFTPVNEPYKDRVLLAGDTGSCQELENSGAMISGWKAGNAIAAAVKEDKFGITSQGISHYLDWWKTVYLEGHRHEDYLMNFAMPYVIDNEEDINYIFNLAKEPLPPCWNPYAVIKHLGQLIQGLVPTIQEERPDILPKLAKMSQPMTEILAPTTKACEPLMELD
jgi:flavin-dependent dehydrogenase